MKIQLKKHFHNIKLYNTFVSVSRSAKKKKKEKEKYSWHRMRERENICEMLFYYPRFNNTRENSSGNEAFFIRITEAKKIIFPIRNVKIAL